ncbi:MAG: ABC transporter permease, partial [Deltaproteobacteria bacterium]|nr:ABC transporter permease [Deltaproteobacteria bacterium]
MWERIKQILIKEFIQILRDPRSRAIVFVMPLVQVIIFGYAVTTDVKNVSTAIYDQDNSVYSREVVDRFVKSGYFQIDEYVSREDQIRELLDQGRVQVLLRFNKGFGRDLTAGRKAPLQLILDGTDSNTAAIVLGYSSKIVAQYSREILADRASRLPGGGPLFGQVNLETRAWFNENLESRNFYVPGVIALLVMLVTLLLTSMAVVREKEIGTMEQIMVTPITPKEFIMGKTVPFILISFIDVILISLVGIFWFEV